MFSAIFRQVHIQYLAIKYNKQHKIVHKEDSHDDGKSKSWAYLYTTCKTVKISVHLFNNRKEVPRYKFKLHIACMFSYNL